MTESHSAGLGARRQDPDGKASLIDRIRRSAMIQDALGRQPLRLVGEVAGIRRFRTQDTELIAAANQDRANGDRGLESYAQVAHAGLRRCPILEHAATGFRGPRPDHLPQSLWIWQCTLGAVDPFR